LGRPLELLVEQSTFRSPFAVLYLVAASLQAMAV
jgi:hypothetical protein